MRSPKHVTSRPANSLCRALAFIALLVFACSSLAADDPAVTSGRASSKVVPDASRAAQGVIATHEGLQLTVKAGCANVRIFTDGSDSVSYAVRLDPKAAGAAADALQDFFLTADKTSRGVMLIGQTQRARDCRSDVTYEIHVPRHYDLDIAVQSGDITAQSMDGIVALYTGGGAIRAGGIGASDAAAKGPASRVFAARLETGGGDICVGNIAGGLRAATAGGQIFAGDVHGPAVLRTGGGDIHVGHVFGGAHFTSGGGDIVARKVDGGVWADTAGGQVEIGNTAWLGAVGPEFATADRAAFPVILDHFQDPQEMPAVSNLADVTELMRIFDAFFWGGIRVDPADEQKRLTQSLAPEYPEVARLAGIEGDVTLRIFVGRDGTIRGITPVSGPPVLARAAMRAVERWRYTPALVDGRPVDVITSVTLAFRLHP